MKRWAIFAGCVAALIAASVAGQLPLAALFNLQALLLVVGGTVLVIFFGFPMKRLQETRLAIRQVLTEKNDPVVLTLTPTILSLAKVWHYNGALALEKSLKNVGNDFLVYGMNLLIAKYDQSLLQLALHREIQRQLSEKMAQVHLLKTVSKLTPALGMLGTVISLMGVMRVFGQSEAVGESISLALSSTLYGLLLAHIIILPIITKLEANITLWHEEQMIIADSVIGISEGEHPLRLAERLNAYDVYCDLQDAREPLAVRMSRAVAAV